MSSEKRKAEDSGEEHAEKIQKLEDDCKNHEQKQNDNENSADDKTRSPLPATDNEEESGDGFSSGGDQAEKKKFRVPAPDHVGTLIICGGTNWDLIGRRDVPKNCKGGTLGRNLYSPHRFGPLKGTRVRLVAAGNTCAHNIIVTEDGTVMSWGRNEKGQLGVGDTDRRDVPTAITALKDHSIVAAACGRHHTLFLSDSGTVFSCGDNKMGQCGIGNQHPIVHTPTRVSFKGRPIVRIDCGGEFSVILDINGVLHSFGCPEYGQLGHNTDGKYFASTNKLAYSCETVPKRILFFIEKGRDGHIIPVEAVEIVQFACGTNHIVAVDSRKRVFSWGFGGFGRLGHAEQKDEMIPRLIKFFDVSHRGVKSVYAGSTYSIAVTELGALFLWGLTKRTGDANMYPKPVQDLAGWNVRCVGCANTSIVVAADESVIAWGPSPTNGELGLGELRKSSTTPAEVKALEGIHVHQVTCGMGHTLMVAQDDTEQDKAKLQNLAEYCP